MNIAIDIDDTLTDSFEHFLPCVAEYFGVSAQSLRERGISYNCLPPEWKDREDSFGRAYYDTTVPLTPFKPDAAHSLRQLRDQGHRIVIITARTRAHYTDPCKTTREQLERAGIPYDRLICSYDKAGACLEEKVSLLVDDMPANCSAAAARGIPVLLFTSRANAGLQLPFPRAENWAQALSYIEGMAGA